MMNKFEFPIKNKMIRIDNIQFIPKITTTEEILKIIGDKKYSIHKSKKTIIHRFEIN